MVKETEKTLKQALLVASKEKKTDILKTRIKICCPNGDGTPAQYFILDGGKDLGEMTLNKLLNIGIVDLFNKEQMVATFMNIALGSLAFKNEIPLNEANVRIYTKDAETNEPLFCFLKNNEIVKHLSVEEIIELYQEYAEQQQEGQGTE
jgi:hypothetical protein